MSADKSKRFDVVVIGAGVAGFVAAISLRRRGKSVAVIARAGGASSVSSGAWDFGIIPPEGPHAFETLRQSTAWKQAYRRVLVEADELLRNEEAESLVRELTSAFADTLPLTFDLKRGLCLPTTSGLWKRTFGAQTIQARTDLRAMNGKKVGVVASDHWRYRADLLASRWKAKAAAEGITIDLSPFWIDLRLDGADWPLPRVATHLANDERFREEVRTAIDRRLHGGHYDVLLFPPMFLDPFFADRLQREFNVVVAEALATVEPVAGQRLRRAMQATLSAQGIPLLHASRVEADLSGEELRAAKVYQASGWEPVEADHFILATGKYFAGGLSLDFDTARETLLALPLYFQRGKGALKGRGELEGRTAGFREDALWARLGVWVDKEWRPIGEGQKPRFRNVRACGSVIGGIDYARENIGLGFMAYGGKRCADGIA